MAEPTPTTPGTVLITGCSSGIGHATALRLVRKGWTVWATARRTETLTELEEAGCRTVALDVTDAASMTAAVERVEETDGGVDALVNNAGYSQSGAIETVTPEQVRAQFETHIVGPIRLAQLVLPGMRERRRGRIINIGSMGGTLTLPGAGVYHASKHALEAINDALRFEVSGWNVQVVLIQPGLIRTEFSSTVARHLQPSSDGGPYQHFHERVRQLSADAYESGPLARLGGGPEDVAKVVEKALTADRPKTRYTVTASATLLMTQRRLFSDRMWDRFLRTQYPVPGTE